MPRWLAIVVGMVSLPIAVAAQQPAEPSDVQKLRQLQFELNTCDMMARQARKTLTDELRQAIDRAEKAEAAQALAMNKAPTPKPDSEQK